MANNKNFNVGDRVWWFGQWDTLRNDEIYGIEDVAR